MPNRGHRWTAEEDEAALALGWPDFSQRFPGVSRHAYRARRYALRTQTEPVAQRGRFRSIVHRLVCGD